MFPKNILAEKKGPGPGAPQIWALGSNLGPWAQIWAPGPKIWALGPLQRHLPLPALIYQTFDKSGQVEVDAFGGGPGPKFWAQGPKFGPMGPDLIPGPKSGGPRARAPSFPLGYFLETRARILTRPTFKKKLPLQASRPFPEGAPRKVSMFKIYLAGRSSDMSVS